MSDVACAGVSEALAGCEPMGPFFRVLPRCAGELWRPMSELVDGSTAMVDRIAAMRCRLQGRNQILVDDKAVASAVQFAFAARLISPALGSAVLGGWVPDLSLSRLRWQPTASNPVPMALAEVSGRRCRSPEEVAEAVYALVVEPAMRPLVEATMVAVAVSPQVLWGNVASALAGAAVMIGSVYPDRAAAALDMIAAILTRPPLEGGGQFDPAGGFHRSTCCLFYRLPRGALCADCVLAPNRQAR